MNETEFMQRAMNCERTLYRIARSILWNDQDAADAVQEAILKGWAHRGRLREDEKFDAWLARILVNECRSMQRKMFLRRRALQDMTPAPSGVKSAGLYDAMAKLSNEYRLLITLHHAEGYSLGEIAEITGMREGLVKSKLYQARQLLEKYMGDEKEE